MSPDGVVTGLAEGTARLVAVAADGGHTDILEVTVEPAAAKLRALIVGQQMYEEGVNSVRVGSINTAQSVSFLLQSQNVDGESYETTVLLDSGARADARRHPHGVRRGKRGRHIAVLHHLPTATTPTA